MLAPQLLCAVGEEGSRRKDRESSFDVEVVDGETMASACLAEVSLRLLRKNDYGSPGGLVGSAFAAKI